MERKKILFLSDAVSCTSGLGRITRDLAMGVHRVLGANFEVASVGYGSPGSAAIPFKEYHLHNIDNWVVQELPAIWKDFVGEEDGILMVVWDMSRLYWLGMPQTCPNPHLRKWVETARMQKWAYHAIDAEGPNGKLSHRIAETMKGFDRVLDYSAFSSKITGNPEFLRHGIDSTVFYPRDKATSRAEFAKSGFVGLKPDSLLLGVVATNQPRKNWQLAMETARILLERGHDVRLWAHTDVMDRYWSLGNLVVDYGLVGRVAITTHRFTDEQMCYMYSACDATLGIAPEGFGYPIAESLACGVPCICGSYGAQSEFVPKSMQVTPVAYFHEGAYCSKRPVHHASAWAKRVEDVLGEKKPVSLPESIDWAGGTLWPSWAKWFMDGIQPHPLAATSFEQAPVQEGQ